MSLQSLLQGLPAGLDQSPQDVPSLALTGSGGIVLNGNTLTVTGTQAAVIDTHGATVQAVADQMPAGVTAQVLQDGPAELLLLGGSLANSATIPVTLTIAQAPLWQMLAVFARALTDRERNLQDAVAQVNLRAATGLWLDFWAATLGLTRYAGEPDTLFIRRLIGLTLSPNANNVVIEQLFASLGYTVTATDGATPLTATVDVQYPSSAPEGFTYTTAQLQALVNQVKSLGVVVTVNFLQALLDTFGITDSIASASTGLAFWGGQQGVGGSGFPLNVPGFQWNASTWN